MAIGAVFNTAEMGLEALAGAARAARAEVLTLSRSRFPESAAHIEDAVGEGQPSTLTLDRAGASANRRAALKGTSTKAGLDRDEYPPAMFKEGGKGASVRYLNPTDNRGAGACLANQCRALPDATTVTIRIVPEE